MQGINHSHGAIKGQSSYWPVRGRLRHVSVHPWHGCAIVAALAFLDLLRLYSMRGMLQPAVAISDATTTRAGSSLAGSRKLGASSRSSRSRSASCWPRDTAWRCATDATHPSLPCSAQRECCASLHCDGSEFLMQCCCRVRGYTQCGVPSVPCMARFQP